jgi:hypothetical protein
MVLSPAGDNLETPPAGFVPVGGFSPVHPGMVGGQAKTRWFAPPPTIWK